MQYSDWTKLEKMMEASEDVIKSLAQKYPNEISNWIILRRRQGRQCHPPGTLIHTANRGQVPIESLNQKEDLVQPWISELKGFKVTGHEFTITKRDYCGRIIKISAGGKSYLCTSDHMCIAEWNDSANDLFGVYLMRKDRYWRVGKVKIFAGGGLTKKRGSGLLARARQEQAAEAWLLGVYKSNTEALLAEEKFSVVSQTAKSCFIATSGTRTKSKHNGLYKWVTQEQLNRHHESICWGTEHYRKFLRSVGLSIYAPFWSINSEKKAGPGTRGGNEIVACNLIDEHMNVHVLKDKIMRTKSTISLPLQTKSRMYTGWVYSLHVPDYETYLANDIVTHNCPMARGVLKQIIWFESKNKKFTENLETETWNENWA